MAKTKWPWPPTALLWAPFLLLLLTFSSSVFLFSPTLSSFSSLVCHSCFSSVHFKCLPSGQGSVINQIMTDCITVTPVALNRQGNQSCCNQRHEMIMILIHRVNMYIKSIPYVFILTRRNKNIHKGCTIPHTHYFNYRKCFKVPGSPSGCCST